MSSGGGGGGRTFVTELQPNDVLMGRGAPISDNRGNRRFLSLIREKCSDYQHAETRKEKDTIARQVVSTIHARNGLFLRKIDSPEEAADLGVPPEVAAWTTADEKTVLLKIKQALRDRGLEVKGQGRTPPQDRANATELPADCDDEELGADDMVAHGIPSHESQQPPPAKRAKQTPSDVVRQNPVAAVTTMPAPPPVPPAAGINPFQGALTKPNVPLFANFSQGFNRGGTLISQPLFTPHLPQLPLEQGWNANAAAAAGLNIPPAGVNPNLQLDGGKLQADFRAAFATHPQAASANLQVKGGELKIDEASTESPKNETVGDIALRIACDICEKGQTPSDGVKLDPIELCLLSVLNSRGLPTWSSTQFRNGDIYGASNNTPCLLTWSDVGNHLVQEVQSFLSRMTSKLFPNDTAGQRGSAIAGFVSRLGSLASAYSKNPTRLACMTVMLLEKLRMLTAASATASDARRSYAGMDYSSRGALPIWISDSDSSREGTVPGRGSSNDPRGVAMDSLATMPEAFLFQTYITTELSLWAASLNVADDNGFSVPCSSHDFVANFPQYAQYDVFSTAAALDRFGCQAVLCQVTYLTRLRSLFQKSSSDQMLSILRTSSLTPSWGTSIDETALLDMSLLQALLVNGFSGLFDSTKTDDLLGILLRQKSITKADVEKRVVQLTCLLHKHVQSAKITQVINQQAASFVEMIGR